MDVTTKLVDATTLAELEAWVDSAMVDGGGAIADGLAMRAMLEWAREVSGDESLYVGSVRERGGKVWWYAEGGTHWVVDEVPTEAEAHVARAEWAARSRP